MAFRFVFSLAVLMMVFLQQASAQAIFEKVSIPKTVIATGHTETLGLIEVIVRQNSTLADTLVIDVSPLKITNSNAADIRVTTSGAITVGATSVDSENGLVRIPVNGGAATGFIMIEGIRVSVAGTRAMSVTARLSWERGLNIFREVTSGLLSSRASALVVDKVTVGLAVEPAEDNFSIYGRQVVKDNGAVVIHEGFATAFSDATDFGQGNPTQVQFRVTDLPQGLRIRFPASVTETESGATLTTVENTSVEVPRAGGNATVTYNFHSTAASYGLIESFRIPFTVSIDGDLGPGQPTIEATLAPVGDAIPTASLPSTNVTRFAADYLTLLEGTSKIVTKRFYWTGIDGSLENRLSLLNSSTRAANLKLSAFDAAGKEITGSPVSASLSPNQLLDQSIGSFFGNSSAISTLRIESTVSDVIGMGTSKGSGVSESLPLSTESVSGFALPILGDRARLEFFNPGSEATSGTLTLLSAQGAVLSTTPVTLDPMASISRTAADLFGANAAGQVRASFSSPVIGMESSGRNTLNFVQSQIPVETESWYVPFFAIGGRFQTDLSLINPSEQTIRITAQLFDGQGSTVRSTKEIVLSPSQNLLTTIGGLFDITLPASIDASPVTGYVRLRIAPVTRWIITYYPGILGHVRVHAGEDASSVFPIVSNPGQVSYLLNSASPAGFFQGFALVNPGTADVNVTIDALNGAGGVLSSRTVTLKGGEMSSKLASEYFTTAVPEHSTFRLSSSSPIVVTSLIGSASLDSLQSIPGLR